MLTVTDAALQHLQHALSRVEAASACFRLTVSDQDTLGLIVQQPEAGDRTYECDGETVLATPEPLVEVLAERVLDLDDDGHLVLVPKPA
jgi:Fe-S cluster assembly iron-binding protein IscA